MDSKLKILLLANNNHHTSAIADHLSALTKHSQHDWLIENPLKCKVLHKLDFSVFDAVGIHLTLRHYKRYYVNQGLFKALQSYQGVKFLFLHDEYEDGKKISDAILSLGIDIFFTIVRPEEIEIAYPDLYNSTVKVVSVITSCVPARLLDSSIVPPLICDRPLDVFYRTRTFDYWLGSLAQERHLIADGVLQRSQQYQLSVDIAPGESERIYGEAWVQKHYQTRAVLATESGASIWDYDGSIEAAVKSFLQKKHDASFEEVYDAVLKDHEYKVKYTCISPRVFEAIALKTGLIMFPGYYSGILVPNRHYIPLAKDFSNFDDVVKKLKDDVYMQNLVDRTYNEIALSYDFSEEALSKMVDTEISKLVPMPIQSKPVSVKQIMSMIQKKKRSFLPLDVFCRCYTELVFAAKNFFKVLFDGSLSCSGKFNRIFSGFGRYRAYFIARYFKRYSA